LLCFALLCFAFHLVPFGFFSFRFVSFSFVSFGLVWFGLVSFRFVPFCFIGFTFVFVPNSFLLSLLHFLTSFPSFAPQMLKRKGIFFGKERHVLLVSCKLNDRNATNASTDTSSVGRVLFMEPQTMLLKESVEIPSGSATLRPSGLASSSSSSSSSSSPEGGPSSALAASPRAMEPGGFSLQVRTQRAFLVLAEDKQYHLQLLARDQTAVCTLCQIRMNTYCELRVSQFD
jgi:hypothetical protein